MLSVRPEHNQILGNIIERVPVQVMHDLAFLRLCNLTTLTLASLAAIPVQRSGLKVATTATILPAPLRRMPLVFLAAIQTLQ